MKPNLKNFIAAVSILSLLACNGKPNASVQTKPDNNTTKPAIGAGVNGKVNPADDNLLLEKAIDSIHNTAKVQALTVSINKNASLQHKLAILTAGTPADGEPYYWLKVGEDTPDNFVTIYHFHVYLHPLKIMSYSVSEEKEISLDTWEKKKD